MLRLTRPSAALLLVAVFGVAAHAQERGGAGRVELNAFPGGGVLFTQSSGGAEPDFTNYTLGVSFTWNANRWVGLETEAGFGIGGQRTVRLAGQTLAAQAMPDTMAFSEDLILNPIGSDRAIVPYAAGGVGLFSLLHRDGTEALGLTDTQTFYAANVGGGLKWYAARGWGLRTDYRVMIVRPNGEAPPFFGGQETRYGHRFYASIFANF